MELITRFIYGVRPLVIFSVALYATLKYKG